MVYILFSFREEDRAKIVFQIIIINYYAFFHQLFLFFVFRKKIDYSILPGFYERSVLLVS